VLSKQAQHAWHWDPAGVVVGDVGEWDPAEMDADEHVGVEERVGVRPDAEIDVDVGGHGREHGLCSEHALHSLSSNNPPTFACDLHGLSRMNG